MNYSEEMNLLSSSGYCMPCDTQEPMVKYLGYGKQIHPKEGKEFFHNGVDYKVPHPATQLYALATGYVSGILNDPKKGFCLTITYPYTFGEKKCSYAVTYAHIAQCRVNYGESVTAGQVVAITNDNFFHLDVSYNGKNMDPQPFIEMLAANFFSNTGGNDKVHPNVPVNDMSTHTPYDASEQEVDTLMFKFIFPFIRDIMSDRYTVPQRQVDSLSSYIKEGKDRGYYNEAMPSFANPTGVGNRAVASGFIDRIQTLILDIFFTYLAQTRHLFLRNATEDQKKKFLNPMP